MGRWGGQQGGGRGRSRRGEMRAGEDGKVGRTTGRDAERRQGKERRGRGRGRWRKWRDPLEGGMLFILEIDNKCVFFYSFELISGDRFDIFYKC